MNGPFSCTPIGYLRCSKQVKFYTPHQPDESVEEQATIELSNGFNFEQALRDVEGFERIWLVWWFHKNTTWRPLVLPPRGPAQKRGVFATRSPHRPNPIGVTNVKLLSVSGRTLTIGSHDLLDGTPILDIKPYLPSVDSHPAAREGWIGDISPQLEGPPRYAVRISEIAAQQQAWLLRAFSIDFISRAVEILSRNPEPHRTRRIAKLADGVFRIGCGAWRCFFTNDAGDILIQRITPGYPQRVLLDSSYDRIPDREAQLAFEKMWPSNR